eukprot:3199053-Lingulodinium_polyedra.AAC.1
MGGVGLGPDRLLLGRLPVRLRAPRGGVGPGGGAKRGRFLGALAFSAGPPGAGPRRAANQR